MRAYFPTIYKNRALAERFGNDITQNTLSHAYILEGPPGSGKKTFATQIAAALLCRSRHNAESPLPCLVCEPCRRVLAGLSPDLICIAREGDRATLGIEAIRFIRQSLYLSTSESDCKIYIIEDAHLMTPQAQNAFLKALEEPPPFAFFILLSENGDNILDTVKSRAPTLYTEQLRPEEIADYLLAHHKPAQKLREKSPAAFDGLVAAAQGTIGNALDLLAAAKKEASLPTRTQAAEILDRFFSHGARLDFFAPFLPLAQTKNEKRSALSEILSLVALGLRDILAIKKYDGAGLCFYTDREALLENSVRITASAALRLFDATTAAISDLAKNANINTLMLNYANQCHKILTGGRA